MKNPRLTVLMLLLACLFILLAFIFRLFLLDAIVRPVALVLWLIWRVLLSFDQRVIWSLLIFAAVFIALLRLAQHGFPDNKSAAASDPHLTLANIKYWRTFILLSADEKAQVNILKQSLVEILAVMYTSRDPDTPHWEVVEALRRRQIPLPDPVYAFLFPPKALAGRPSFRQRLQTIRRLPAEWARQRSGRAAAEYYASIEEVLSFVESSLEINHDDQP